MAMDDLDVLRQAVLDHSLAQISNTPLQTSLTKPLRVGELTFTPTAQMAIRVLNRSDDKDDDAVFGKDDAHIAFDLHSAWVKYKIALKSDAKLAFGALSAKASTDLELSDYRIHDATDGAWNAMNADLSSPRTLLTIDDVRSLKPGEAMSMELGGALSASVSFSWSDVIASQLGEIVQGLAPRVPIAVKLHSGLEVSATVSVQDHFAVVISRTRDGHFRIAVKKARSRDHAFGIDVSFGAEVTAVPALDDALDAIFKALDPEGKQEETAAAALRSELRTRLVELARWKATTGFAYEYARIDESVAIADFILLDDAKLADDYPLAIRGDFAKLSDALRDDPASRTLVKYLNETALIRKSSSGFSLGPISAKDTSVFKLTTRTSLDGFQLITARGTRRYDEKLLAQNDYEWTVDLKAQMKEFAAAPTSLDFDYGLHCSVMLERSVLHDDDLARMLDFARMWDVRTPDASLISEAVGRKGSIRVQWMLERDALMATLGAFRNTIDDWAAPLGAAMPYASNFAERRTFDARRAIYAPAWSAWLAGQPVNLRIRSGLGLLEERALPGSFAWMSGIGHPQLRSRLDAFLRGAKQLHDAMTTAQAPEVIGTAYDLD
ncbi:MAG TPA: hypothetical protein VGQ76_25965, partial [Thermoanaerobaculia bacterium]|nr:hypothetical protein [Thermoanaerobaculia bacterium]